MLEGIRIVLLPRSGRKKKKPRDGLGAGSGFVAAASSFVEFAGTSALDAMGDETESDESDSAEDHGVGKESKMKHKFS